MSLSNRALKKSARVAAEILQMFDKVERGLIDLHEYQRVALEFIRANPFCALFIDLGLGKTITSLTLAVELLESEDVSKVLVIAPLRVANKTWPDEIPLWQHTAAHTFSVLTGSEANRLEAVRSSRGIHITNKESVEWLVDYWKADWPYDMVIIDESSAFKDHRTKRFKALRNVRPYIKRLIELTATPAAETYMHLFAQVFLLDEGKRFGKHITKFEERYFTYNKYSRKSTLRPGAKEEIEELIADICLVMRAEDYLDMKKPVFTQTKVRMTKREKEQYDHLEREFFIEIEDVDGEPVTIEAETAASLSAKLLQLASGVLYQTVETADEWGDFSKHRVVHEIHNHKIEELRRIVEEAQGDPILVSYHFKSSLDRLKKAFPQAVPMDKEGKAVTAWNKGKIPILLCHPQSAGHGLNLQKGGRRIVFFDIPWSLELYLQLIGRLQRQGQTRLVMVDHLVADGTLDELVVGVLQGKEGSQEELFRRLKSLQKRALAELKKRAAATRAA